MITHIVTSLDYEIVNKRVDPAAEGPGWVKIDVPREPDGKFCSANANRIYKATLTNIILEF